MLVVFCTKKYVVGLELVLSGRPRRLLLALLLCWALQRDNMEARDNNRESCLGMPNQRGGGRWSGYMARRRGLRSEMFLIGREGLLSVSKGHDKWREG